jgi:hypothetical protein
LYGPTSWGRAHVERNGVKESEGWGSYRSYRSTDCAAIAEEHATRGLDQALHVPAPPQVFDAEKANILCIVTGDQLASEARCSEDENRSPVLTQHILVSADVSYTPAHQPRFLGQLANDRCLWRFSRLDVPSRQAP